jgi:hypothetical protein
VKVKNPKALAARCRLRKIGAAGLIFRRQNIEPAYFHLGFGGQSLLVCRHASRRTEIACATARGVYDNLLGVVLNKVELKALNRYEGHGNYYYSGHFAHDGYTD